MKRAPAAAGLVRRAAPIVASLLVSACAALVGIDENLGVKGGPLDAGGAPDGAAPEATDTGPPADAGDATIAPPVRPPEGAYVYAASGGDQIQGAFAFPESTYGPNATATVTYIGTDCFDLTITLRTDYVEAMRFCVSGLDVVEESETRTQKFPGATTATTETCKPGDVYYSTAPSPTSFLHDCTGQNTDSKSGDSSFVTAGTYDFAGTDTIQVEGKDVVTKHYYQDAAVTGAQTGSNVADWYFSVEDGTLVRLMRKVDISYDSVVGKITYTETANMTLTAKPGTQPDGG